MERERGREWLDGLGSIRPNVYSGCVVVRNYRSDAVLSAIMGELAARGRGVGKVFVDVVVQDVNGRVKYGEEEGSCEIPGR